MAESHNGWRPAGPGKHPDRPSGSEPSALDFFGRSLNQLAQSPLFNGVNLQELTHASPLVAVVNFDGDVTFILQDERGDCFLHSGPRAGAGFPHG